VRHFAPTTCELKIEAEEWLAQEYRDIQTAKAAVRSALHSGKQPRFEWLSPKERLAEATEVTRETISEYGKRYIEQRDLKTRTRIHYTNLLEKHIVPKLGDIVVSNLRPAMVRSWYATTLKDKPVMRSHAYQLLHAICATAISDELLSANPCQIEKAMSVKRTRETVVPDIDSLAMIADRIEPKFKALVLISSWCGLRFDEAIELCRKDISDGCEIITIARVVTHRARQDGETKADRCIVDTPKSGKPRTGSCRRRFGATFNRTCIPTWIVILNRCCSCPFAVAATSPTALCVTLSVMPASRT
jgi:integrase